VPPALSIVIPSYNRPDLLQICLASVERHAPQGVEVVVVDDGSRNEVVSRAAAAFAGVRTCRLSRRRGFCAAANAGLRAVRGEIVELLNDDTEVTAGWAGAALARFADPRIAAVAPLVIWSRERQGARPIIDSAGDRYYLGGIAGKRGHGQPLGEACLRPCRVFGASASSAFYRRDLVLRVGAFPERFGSYFEDVDLAFRLHRAGYEVWFEPGARVFHRVASSFGQSRRDLVEQQALNEERVFWRNLCGASLRQALPQHLLVLVAKAWKRWQEGRLAPFVCGRLRILGEIGHLRRHRRWLQELGADAAPEDWLVDRRFLGNHLDQ
jgi:GT2 family glycosyltransferase